MLRDDQLLTELFATYQGGPAVLTFAPYREDCTKLHIITEGSVTDTVGEKRLDRASKPFFAPVEMADRKLFLPTEAGPHPWTHSHSRVVTSPHSMSQRICAS